MRHIFEARADAERFCEEQGWSLGRLQGPSPRGIICSPQFDIQKWRNLRRSDREGLDGVMVAYGRGGPFAVLIGREHVQSRLRAA